jgi:hypothetical protein
MSSTYPVAGDYCSNISNFFPALTRIFIAKSPSCFLLTILMLTYNILVDPWSKLSTQKWFIYLFQRLFYYNSGTKQISLEKQPVLLTRQKCLTSKRKLLVLYNSLSYNKCVFFLSLISTNKWKWSRGLLCVVPLWTIFPLYHGSLFYWWRKPECPDKTTNLLQVTDKLYHLMLYGVNLAMSERK